MDPAAASGVGAGLKSRRWDSFKNALGEAVRLGSAEWDEALTRALNDPNTSRDRRIMIAAALGQMPSRESSNGALRAKLRAADSPRDLRHATMWALARRLGAHATPDLLHALRQRDALVKWTAVICLAAVGNREAFDDVLEWLRRSLKKGHAGGVGDNVPPPRVAAIAYVARFADPSQQAELSSLARCTPWTSTELEWLQPYWPTVVSSLGKDRPGGGDGEAIRPDWRSMQARLQRRISGDYIE